MIFHEHKQTRRTNSLGVGLPVTLPSLVVVTVDYYLWQGYIFQKTENDIEIWEIIENLLE